MPYGYGPVTFTSSSGGDIGGGRAYTRLRGPVLVGQSQDVSGWPLGSTQPPHLTNVSTQRADMLISVVSSFAVGAAGVTSSSLNVSTGAPTGLVYITQCTGAGNIMAGGSTANAPVGLPGGKNGVALLWDGTKKTLSIYDPLTETWLWPHLGATVVSNDVIVWTACSS